MHVELLAEFRQRLLTPDAARAAFALNAGLWFRRDASSSRLLFTASMPIAGGKFHLSPAFQISRSTSTGWRKVTIVSGITAYRSFWGYVAGFSPPGYAASLFQNGY
jgi:hypothetical protein